MNHRRLPFHRTLIALVLLATALVPAAARADTDAANACATKLSPDAKAIFDATLPQVVPGANLRSLLTASTRKLAYAGAIEVGSARASATAASQCLRLATK
jgi:hypothetical protein